MPTLFNQEKRARVRLSIKHLWNLMDTLEARQKELISSIQYDQSNQKNKNEYITIQQQLEVLSVMRNYIEIMNYNLFVSMDTMLDILEPKGKNGQILTLEPDNAQAYFDAMCENILAIKDEKRNELLKFFASMIFVGIVAVIMAAVFLHAVPASAATGVAITMGVLIGTCLAIGLPGFGITRQESKALTKAKVYLKAAQEGQEVDLITDKHYFSFRDNFRQGGYEAKAIHVEFTQDAIYCHIFSGLFGGRDFYKTVKLSDDLVSALKQEYIPFTSDGRVIWSDSSAVKSVFKSKRGDIFKDIRARTFTTVIPPSFGMDGGGKIYLSEQRATLKQRFFGTQTENSDKSLSQQFVAKALTPEATK